MKVEATTVFNFSFVAEGTSYNFGITANTQNEACEKLHRALVQIAGELKESLKMKPN